MRGELSRVSWPRILGIYAFARCGQYIVAHEERGVTNRANEWNEVTEWGGEVVFNYSIRRKRIRDAHTNLSVVFRVRGARAHTRLRAIGVGWSLS